MKNSSILVLFSFLLSFNIYGQYTVITTENKLKEDANGYMGIVSLKNQSFATIQQTKKFQLLINKYETSGKIISSNIIDNEASLKSKLKFIDIISLGDKTFLMFEERIKENHSRDYFAQAFNIESNTPIGDLKKITSEKCIERGTFNSLEYSFNSLMSPILFNTFYKNLYILKNSPDSSKLLLGYNFKTEFTTKTANPNGKKDGRLYINVYDSKMNTIWEEELIFEHDNYLQIFDLQITNDGKIIVLAKGNYQSPIKLFIFQKDTRTVSLEVENNKKKVEVVDGKILSLKNGSYSAVGAYSYNEKPAGFYSSSFLSNQSSSVNIALNDFPKSTFTEDTCKNIYLRNILSTSDNGYSLVYEKYERRESINQSQSTSGGVDTHSGGGQIIEQFGNVYVLKTDMEGKIAFIIDIPKLQYGARSTISQTTVRSINCFSNNNQINIIFRDNIKNLTDNKADWKKEYEMGRFAYFAAISVDSKGEFSKFNLGKEDDLLPNIKLDDLFKIGNAIYYIGKNNQVLSIQIK